MPVVEQSARLFAGTAIAILVGCGNTSTPAPTDPDSGADAAGSRAGGTASSAGAGSVNAGGAATGGSSTLPECIPSDSSELPDFIAPVPDLALPVEYAGRGTVQSTSDVALTIALEPSGQLQIQRLALPPLAKAGDELGVKLRRVGNGPQDEDMAFELRNTEGELILFSYQMPYDATVLEGLGAPITLSFEPLCDDTRRDNCHSVVKELVTVVSHDDGQARASPRTSQSIQVGGRPFALNVYFSREFGVVTCSPAFHQPAPGIHATLQLVAQEPR